LKQKANGGSRLVIAYMSIGEAEDYRYYWQSAWKANNPEWLAAENTDWPGNYKVKYWENNWQKIIYGNENSYIKKFLMLDLMEFISILLMPLNILKINIPFFRKQQNE
jgi:cysteinyl-tRNA synthetase, unknown class